MTAVDVDALDKLRAAATAGPWAQDVYEIVATRHRFVAETGWRPDAALIVAAVNALPEMLAEVRRGRALREAVEGLAEQVSSRFAPQWFSDSEVADRIRAVLAATDGTP